MPLSKRAVTAFLCVHLLVVWGAVLLRVDRYPLTWAPMYAVYKRSSADPKIRQVKLKPRRRLEDRGWRATHRDGSQSWVSRRTLNVPRRNMWRLYYERTFGKAAPRYKQLNADGGRLENWLFGREGRRRYERPKPRRDLLISINRSLGYGPEDPRLIVALEAHQEISRIDRDTGEELERTARQAEVRWNPRWAQALR